MYVQSFRYKRILPIFSFIFFFSTSLYPITLPEKATVEHGIHNFIAYGHCLACSFAGFTQTFFPVEYIASPAGCEFLDIEGPVSLEEEKEIKDILREVGLDPEKITILEIIPEKYLASAPEAMAWGSSVLLVGLDYLNELPKEQKRAIIGHEARHLYNRDQQKLCYAIFLPFIIHYGLKEYTSLIEKGFNVLKDNPTLKKLWLSYPLKTLFNAHQTVARWAITKGYITWNILNRFSRYQEKQADIESATVLHSARALAQYFENVRLENIAADRFDTTTDGNAWKDVDHPPLTERIAYLTELAEKQEKLTSAGHQAAPAA